MNLNQYIEHTLVKADCSAAEIEQKCQEALTEGFYAVCIPPYHVKRAHRTLNGTPVKIVSVVGYPFGYAPTPVKVAEIMKVIEYGADEIDAAINISAIKSEDWNYVRNDIDSMSTAVRIRGKVIKFILQIDLLTLVEMEKLASICQEMQIGYITIATALLKEESLLKTVQLLKEILPSNVKIKIAGQIKTLSLVERLLAGGVDRLEYPGHAIIEQSNSTVEVSNGSVRPLA